MSCLQSQKMKRNFDETEIEEEAKLDIKPATKKQKNDDFYQVLIKDISKWTVEDAEINVMILYVANARFVDRFQKAVVEAIVMDEKGDKIKVTAWEQEGLRLQRFRILDTLKIKVFRVKKTNVDYRYFHDYFIAIGYKTNLTPLFGAEDALLRAAFKTHWNFQAIQDVKQHPDDSLVDVAGIIIDDQTVNARRRDLTIMDETGVLTVTLWSAQIQMTLQKHDVVGIASGKVSSYNNGSLQSVGLIMKNPDCEMITNLQSTLRKMTDKKIYEKVVENFKFQEDMQNLKSFVDVQDMQLQFGSNLFLPFRYFTVKGFVCDVDHYEMFYGENEFHYEAPITIKDENGNKLRIIAFDEAGERIFENTATDLRMMQQRKPRSWMSKMQQICKKKIMFLFKIQAKVNDYQNRNEVQLLCQQVKEIMEETEVKTNEVSASHQVNALPVKTAFKEAKKSIPPSIMTKMHSLSVEPQQSTMPKASTDMLVTSEDEMIQPLQNEQLDEITASSSNEHIQTQSMAVAQQQESTQTKQLDSGSDETKLHQQE